MTLATNLCPHGVNRYESACGRCEFEYRAFKDAQAAYGKMSHELNGGGEPRIVAAVLRGEHPYLLQKLNTAVAMAIIGRTYDSECNETGTIFDGVVHPEHDGRLSCGDVIGALRALGISGNTEHPVAAARFWRDRIYDSPA